MLARASLAATICLTLVTAACSRSHVPVQADYDRSCATNDDCVGTFVGNAGCCGGYCPNAAIRGTEFDRAMKEREDARTCATPLDICPMPPPCTYGPGVCVSGVCQLWKHPAQITPDVYDHSCASVSDCEAVFVGELNGCLHCPNTAVRSDQLNLITSDELEGPNVGGGECKGGIVCHDGRVQCVNGLCELELPDAGSPEAGD